MKTLRNATMALLAAGMMAACSSTRNADMGGTSNTTGMDSGSSNDLSNNSDATDNTSADYSSNPITYENNSDREDIYGNNSADYSSNTMAYENHSDAEAGYGNNSEDYSSNSSNAMTYENNSDLDAVYGNTLNSDYVDLSSNAGGANVWARTVLTDFNSDNVSPMSYIMNGYQGPLNYVSFDNFISSQSFLPLSAENSAREIELSRIAQRNAVSADVKAFANMMVREHSANSEEIGSIASFQNITLATPDFVSAVNTFDPYHTDVIQSDDTYIFFTLPNTNSIVNTPDPYNTSGIEAEDIYTLDAGAGNTSELSDMGASNTDIESDDTSISDAGAGNTSAWSDTGTSNNGMSSTAATTNEINMLRNLSGREFDRQYMRIMLQDAYQNVALFTCAAESDDPQVSDFAKKSLPVLQADLDQATDVYNTLL